MNSNKLFAALAVFAFVLSGSAAMMGGLDATENMGTTEDNPAVINLAPGYRWTYTPTFPSDLAEHITVTVTGEDNIAEVIDGKTVIVTIPTSAKPQDEYSIEITASMTTPVEQSTKQYVKFVVVGGLTVSGTISDMIQGTSVNFEPTVTAGMGGVTWKLKQGCTLPDGLTLGNDGKVTGTPTKTGPISFTLVATATGGESKELPISFTVYSQLVFTSAPTCGAVIYAV